MQTQSLEARLEGISVLKSQIELSRSAAVERICDVGNGVMVTDYRSGHSRWQTATIGQQVMQGGNRWG